MKPVNQTNTTKERGDCQRASVATLFDLELEQVPNFILYENELGWSVLCSFVWALGYELIEWREDEDFEATKDGCLLASIKSDYGSRFSHQVVINTKGVIVHDPLPNNPNNGRDVVKDGILDDWYRIVKRGEK